MGATTTQRGQGLVMMVLVLAALLGLAAITVDAGSWYLTRHTIQGDADAGALAGARALVGGQDAAGTAREYATSRNAADGAQVRGISVNGGAVTVQTQHPGATAFLGAAHIARPTISATATARAFQVAGMPGILPVALPVGAFAVGGQYEVKFTNGETGNHGAIRPPMPGGGTAKGANDFRSLLSGGASAAMVQVGSTVQTEPGNMSGPTRQALDSRIGGDTTSIDALFQLDPVTGRYAITNPDSPRIGIIPVVSGAWPNGASGTVTVTGFVIVYIGRTDQAGYPAYTDNGKSMWVTPMLTLLPEELESVVATTTNVNPASPSPITFRLVD